MKSINSEKVFNYGLFIVGLFKSVKLSKKVFKKFRRISSMHVASLNLKGIGFKISFDQDQNVLFFYIGFSHWISVSFDPLILKIFLNADKTKLKVVSRDSSSLFEFCSFIQKFKRKSFYKDQGVFILKPVYNKIKVVSSRNVKKK